MVLASEVAHPDAAGRKGFVEIKHTKLPAEAKEYKTIKADLKTCKAVCAKGERAGEAVSLRSHCGRCEV